MTKPPKTHPWLISRVLNYYACKSVDGFFVLGVYTKKGYYKMSPICGEFLTQQNSTIIGVRVGFAGVINHSKFAIQSYGVPNFGMVCCLGHCCRTVLQVITRVTKDVHIYRDMFVAETYTNCTACLQAGL